MAIELPNLPWAEDALDPYISAKTLSFHHGKHHAAYVSKLNAAVEGTPYATQSLESIIESTAGDASKAGVFNNAAQVWNHTFFWNCMKPGGGGEPTGALAEKISATWGSFAKFREEFESKAGTLFGSGWVWLVDNNGTLEIVQTSNAGTPMTEGKKALLTVDVWEHAYYLDYQNRRPDFVSDFFNHLVNWDFVAQNLGA
jgi:Fe-Mn family superoxide dismutase